MQQPPGYPPGPPGYPPGPPGYPPGPPPGGYGYPPGPPPFGGGPPGPPPFGGGPSGPQYPYGSQGGGGMGGAPPPKQGLSGAAIALIVIVALLAVGGGGCLMCVCYASNKADNASEQERIDKSRARNVRIDTLLSDYRSNEVRADQQYKGKWITVQGGQVDQVHSSYITLGTGKYLEIPEVQCLLKPGQSGKAATLSKGRRISVRGKGGGQLINVLINECEIL